MPSRRKTLHYLGSTLLTTAAVGLLGYGMSAEWSTATFQCVSPGNGTDVPTGNAVVTLRVFIGTLTLVNCPFSPSSVIDVIPQLLESEVTPAALQITLVFLLVLCLLCSAGTILVSLYNSVSNPYETYMGPIGIYTCSSISAVLSLLVLILHSCNVFLANSSWALVKELPQVRLDSFSARLQVGYFMALPYLVLSLAAIAVIYAYHHTTYRHNREQQKPTEDAPVETMMY